MWAGEEGRRPRTERWGDLWELWEGKRKEKERCGAAQILAREGRTSGWSQALCRRWQTPFLSKAAGSWWGWAGRRVPSPTWRRSGVQQN